MFIEDSVVKAKVERMRAIVKLVVDRLNTENPDRKHYVENVFHYVGKDKKVIRKGIFLRFGGYNWSHRGFYGYYPSTALVLEVKKNGEVSDRKAYWTKIQSETGDDRKGEWYESDEFIVCFKKDGRTWYLFGFLEVTEEGHHHWLSFS